ncbi:hypothetical protein FJ420_31065 [Mesorhizobium sp. B3-1-3]|uniref:hypothetical protein n=1 Tax=unclassified Mesorhizobium TaxID=325217 RepID=UPI00112C63BB|nr:MULTISPECIES: hypothetical protein [unclassified Mesorhizobium]TPI60960.1 hypothetical protein FJ420_31065 [Mesorhizobium sp. B3-1-3]TPI67970.1 hypothetical protein FJ424_08380 [Mesorhizobium sp. B3-1-8]
MLTLRAVGRFRLLDAAGIDHSPRSQKARGLIALLAFSPGFSRSRVWLQDKLWSDRGCDQAAASLRQALSDIRRQLGQHCSILQSDRQSVSLDASFFRISFERPASTGPDLAQKELFEDLHISDLHFQDWIRGRRLAIAIPSAGGIDHSASKPTLELARRKVLAFDVDCEERGPLRQLASRFCALASKAIAAQVEPVSFYEADTVTGSTSFDGAAQVVVMQVGVRDGNPRASLSVTISDAGSGCVFWAESAQLNLSAHEADAPSAFYSIASRAVDATVDALTRGNGSADGHEMALRLFNSARILTMTLARENLALADRQCAVAFEMAPSGGPLAWRALIRQISHFQYMTCEFLPSQEPIPVLAARALEAFPEDSMTQCVSAHTEYLFGGDTRQALQLAKRSIQANPLNALAWAALANLQTAISDYRNGYASARRSIDLSTGTRAAHFLQFYGCIAAAGLGDYRLATRHARAAAELSPNFAPPRRYLVALKASGNDGQALRDALQELRQIEPSFEMKLLLDGSYPVNTMRRIPLIDNVEGRLRRGMAGFLEHH